MNLAAITSAALIFSGCDDINSGKREILKLAIAACIGNSAAIPEKHITEVFEESNRPNPVKYSDPVNNDYYFCPPWNYEKEYNATRRYPLLIYLHGRDQVDYLRNLYYMGYDNADGYKYDVAGDFKKKHPCFIYVPQESGSSWDTTKLRNQIEALRSAYRIDDNRLYVHGFSMGGYGTYALVNSYCDSTGRIFAGIIRLNGGSFSTLRNAVAEKAGVWLMIGLEDSADSITGIRNSYMFLKSFPANAGAIETFIPGYPAGTHSAMTWMLGADCQRIVLSTEFPGDGHFITEFPFSQDPSVMEWLFSQSLQNR